MRIIRPVETETAVCRVGDVLSFTSSRNIQVEALAVKEEKDGMLFVTVECVGIESMVYSPQEQSGGYACSRLRGRLNREFVESLPAWLREQLVPFSNGDLLRLPTVQELFGDDSDREAHRWKPMKLSRNRVCFLGSEGIGMCYWLANQADGGGNYYSGVDYMGNPMHLAAVGAYGVRPVFKLRQGP